MSVSIIQLPGEKPEQVRIKEVTHSEGRETITRYRAKIRNWDVGGDTERGAYVAAVDYLRTSTLSRT